MSRSGAFYLKTQKATARFRTTLLNVADGPLQGKVFNKNYCSNVDIFQKFLKVFS